MLNILSKIKGWGAGKAIDALDNLEKPLGDKIETHLEVLRKLDGHGLSKWIVDEVQTWLRVYFSIPAKSDPT